MHVIVNIDAHESHILDVGIAFSVGNMIASLLVSELLTVPEIDHVDQ